MFANTFAVATAVLRMRIEKEYPDMDLETVFGRMISGSYDSVSIGRPELVEKILSFHQILFPALVSIVLVSFTHAG